MFSRALGGIVAIACLISAAPARAGLIDPLLSGRPGTDTVRILAVGKARGLDPALQAEAFAAAHVAPGNERSFVRQLEASTNLGPLMAELRRLEAANSAQCKDIELVWSINAVTAFVTVDIARAVASRPDVQEVMADREIQWKPTPINEDTAIPRPPVNWGVDKVKAKAVWQTGALGQNVRLGLIDTGVDGSHRDLAGKVLRFRDFTRFTGPEVAPFDDEGHGTHCAGIICGGDLSGSPIGVAPKAKLIVAKGLDKNGAGGMIGLIRCLNWMADPDGSAATVDQPTAVSCSWGAAMNVPVVARVFWLSVSALRDAGVVPVFASGNEGQDHLNIPGSYPHAFAVGALESNDTVADFTSRGLIKWSGVTYKKPSISAPGVSIYSTMPGNRYEHMSGTSMATPCVAGLIALLKSARPQLTGAQIEGLLKRTAKDLGTPGEDATFGFGLVDVQAAHAIAVSLKDADIAPQRGMRAYGLSFTDWNGLPED